MEDLLPDAASVSPTRRRRSSGTRATGTVVTKSPRRVRAMRGTQRVVEDPAPAVIVEEVKKPVKKVLSRKAPTPLAGARLEARQKQRSMIIVASVIVIGVGASAIVGLTDTGQINVTQTIEDRNNRIRTNTADERDTIVSQVEVPVQNTSDRADGGLVGLGAPVPLPVPAVDESMATNTDETASSTESITEENPEQADEVLEDETIPVTEEVSQEGVIEESIPAT